MKTTRRTARELALNILYQVDASGVPFDEALATALEFVEVSGRATDGAQVKEYAAMLVSGVREHRDEIDAFIEQLSEGWTLDRQPAVDRNILRIALFEIKYSESAPPIVAVDEAVELAKKYSTAESGKFVNGVLAGYLRDHTPEMEETDLGSTDS